jgi:ATP-dependent Clp protease adaptor protein ClpS
MNDIMLYTKSLSVLAANPLEAPLFDEDVAVELVAKVILFNDEWHTFDEVTEQIVKATGCTADKAETLTLEVHHRGKAMVYEGEMAQCVRVSAILEEISLRTRIEC